MISLIGLILIILKHFNMISEDHNKELSEEHKKEINDIITKYSEGDNKGSKETIENILDELGKVREKYIHEIDEENEYKSDPNKRIVGYDPITFTPIYEVE